MNDILEVEKDILNNLDNLDKFFDEYRKICSKLSECIYPIMNWLKKKAFLKKIGIEIDNLEDNLDLLESLLRGTTWHQIGDNLENSNINVENMAIKLIKIAPKYMDLKEKFTKEINRSWQLVQYKLRTQNDLTKMYNDKFSNNNPKYKINSILAEIKKRCKPCEVDYNIFLTKEDRLREELKLGNL